MTIRLRDYQQECVRRVVECYGVFRVQLDSIKANGGNAEDVMQDASLARVRKELLVLATGLGKTIVFSQVIRELATQYGINALILAHRDELLDQAADKYRMVKPDAVIGKVGSGRHEYGGEVTVASVATVSRPEHLKRLKAIGYGLIIVDEAHHVSADSYQKVLNALPDAFVLMVTATPDRLDKKNILDKEPLYSMSIVDGIQRGYLCDLRVQAIQTHVSLDDVKTSKGDFDEKQLDLAINTTKRNNLIVSKYLEHASGRRAACFCVTVSHATALCYAFNERGVASAVISGETPLQERGRIYSAFRDGSIKILCNVMVLTEGWDEPLVDCIILARPTQSRGLYVQCLGRGVRLAEGKQDCLVLDITDNSFKHRIAPQTLVSAIGKRIRDKESMLEAMLREEREVEEERERIASEHRARIRKLTEKRERDVRVDVFAPLNWIQKNDTTFVLEVGMLKHRIALIEKEDGLFETWARLAPNFMAQCWAGRQPLEWAQQFAEKQARMLIADEGKVTLLDRNAPWRSVPVDPASKQSGMAKMMKIEVTEGMTKGELSDAIDTRMEEKKRRRKAEKEERVAV